MNWSSKEIEKHADLVAKVLSEIAQATDWNTVKTANVVIAAVRASIGILTETVYGSLSESDAYARLGELKNEIESIDNDADQALDDKFDDHSI